MKYTLNIFESYGEKNYGITTTHDDISFTSFPAVVGNSNYDAFLVQARLTDEEVHALTPDVWYDFHEGSV